MAFPVRKRRQIAAFSILTPLATNQKAGSSNPPGRTILTNVYAGFCDAGGNVTTAADVGITSWITCGLVRASTGGESSR